MTLHCSQDGCFHMWKVHLVHLMHEVMFLAVRATHKQLATRLTRIEDAGQRNDSTSAGWQGPHTKQCMVAPAPVAPEQGTCRSIRATDK